MARIDQSQPQDSEALTEYMSKAFNLSPAHVLSNVSYNSNEQLVSFAKAGSLRKASPMGAEEGAAAEHAQNQYTPQQWNKMSGSDRQGAARQMSAGSKQSSLRASFQKTPSEGMEAEASGAAAPDTRRMSEAEKRAYIRQLNAERQAAERAAESDPAKRYPGIKASGRNRTLDAGLRAPADTGAFPDFSVAEGGPVQRRPNLDEIEGSSEFNRSLARQSFSMKTFAKSVNALEMISEKMIKDFGGR